MKNAVYCIMIIVIAFYNFSCQKNNGAGAIKPPLVKTDTLMFYNVVRNSGKPMVYSMPFYGTDTNTFASDAKHPFATNRRLVYIKSGNIVAYSKLDGKYRSVATLTQPMHPCLSFDSRLIAVVDKPADKYQLIKLDTLANSTVLYETNDVISYPCFSSDGSKIMFTQKTTSSSSSLFTIPVTGGDAKRVTPNTAGSYDDYCAVFDQTIYFSRTRMINGIESSEICKTDFSGSSVEQLTNFTKNWTAESFYIKHIRKMDLSTLAFVSNNEGAAGDIFISPLNNPSGIIRVTNSAEAKTYPCVLYNYEE